MYSNYDGAVRVWFGMIVVRAYSDDQIKSAVEDFASAYGVDMNVALRHSWSQFHDEDV